MITLKCPKCEKEFNDYCGENAILSSEGEFVDYDRFYTCPFCSTDFNIQTGEIWNGS
jgi:Pyruvate/2-oxoacid:ferredoxin oxidoreductase delta subunit